MTDEKPQGTEHPPAYPPAPGQYPFGPPQPMNPYGMVRIPPPRRAAGNPWLGAGLVALGHLVWLLWPTFYLLIGASQLVYVVPLAIVFALRNETRTLAGVGIAAGATLVLNGVICGGMYAYFVAGGVH
ncbi:MAG: hypothetical protein IPP14_04595 [Planctomycetes bacterium]|nr:hypothetical protein [Planctomycetota bacterium]